MLVAGAIEQEVLREALAGRQLSPSAVAEAMCAAWAEWVTATPRLRFTLGPKKFFGEGWWRDRRRWPFAEAKVSRNQHAALGVHVAPAEQLNELNAAKAEREAAKQEYALGYWRSVLEHRPEDFCREAPGWVKARVGEADYAHMAKVGTR